MTADLQATKASFYPEQTTRVVIPATVEPIRTKNLYLRSLELKDATEMFEFRRRQDVADWLWPKIPHKHVRETEAIVAGKVFQTPDASGALGRQFYFAIISAVDPAQKVIGVIGINALVPAPSIGYGIHPEFWGRGYVSEAVGGVVDAWWKLERKKFEDLRETETLFAACNKANIGSIKVLQRNGFKILKETPMEGDVVALFGLEEPQDS
ncbi:Acyl-CoA N-acyltransferase [Penicillium canariense]|uniref:Acyl-CoA N-acyltransferase n=1 Tax=Penicillium canariense TaxID=189055 RepID=A0A9W9I5M6_9EURO|nr:Acyl-CoA N-acyltransferase [Penicillium canariense]KAJ5168315.1 Acyl-CoA N-acyltransferase [Penicillium canariense]